MSFKSEIWWKLYGEDKDCTFNAAFYHHLINIDVKFRDDIFNSLTEAFIVQLRKKHLEEPSNLKEVNYPSLTEGACRLVLCEVIR